MVNPEHSHVRTSRTRSQSESERLEDQAIAACGGDMRSAIRALIVANEYFEAEINRLCQAISTGYARGRKRKQKDDAA